MSQERLNKISLSANPIMKVLTNLLRWPIKLALWRLLAYRQEKGVVALIKRIQRERGFMMWPDEMATLYHCARLAAKHDGDFAEVGVASGGSARLLAEAAAGERRLHLFDTFAGLPAPGGRDSGLQAGQYAYSLGSVRAYLRGYNNIFFYQGVFPQSAAAVASKDFAFVHLDVDLYESTLAGLEFFYPRMLPGGIIISHDYSTLPGVRQAFTRFFAGKGDPLLELSTSQCLVIKL